MKILIVDDEPLVRKSLGRACVARGHTIVEASNGTEGLQRWTNENPDIVFVDVLMPGLSGPQLIREMAQFRLSKSQGTKLSGEIGPDPAVLVILMSAFSGDHNVETAQQLGADLFFPKPFEDIFAIVQRAEEAFVERKTNRGN